MAEPYPGTIETVDSISPVGYLCYLDKHILFPLVRSRIGTLVRILSTTREPQNTYQQDTDQRLRHSGPEP